VSPNRGPSHDAAADRVRQLAGDGGAEARLFAAVELPAEVRAALAGFGRAAAAQDPALRAVAAETIHLTLVFLGNRPLEEIEPAAGAVESAASGVAAPLLELGAPLWLAPRRPHVLTVVVADPSGALAALQAAVSVALVAALGLRPEARPFRPHVTVARVRGGRPRRGALPPAPWEGAEPFAGEAVTLFRSHLGGGPARHEPLIRVPLVARP
jgi:2'-5' RNA ligase